MRPSTSEEGGGKGLIAGLVGLLAVGGAALTRLSDDVAQVAATGARSVDEVGGVARIGTAEDGERLLSLVSGAEVAQDLVGLGLQALDTSSASGEPEIAYGRPSPHPVAQYVLVSRVQSMEGTLARCVAQKTWCVVERVDSEEPEALSARFREHQHLWKTDHPTDARWVASLGRSLPAGVEAAWLESDGGQWKIAYAGR